MFAETTDKKEWNEFINNSELTDILQTWEWGECKRIEGWTPYRFVYEQEGEIIIAAQVLVKNVKILGKLAYIPHGPVFQSSYFKNIKYGEFFKTKEWKNFINNLKEWAISRGVFVIEFEPKIAEQNLKLPNFSELKVTGRNRQPKYKLFMDITRPEELLLMDMKKNTRYNINYAIKKGIVVKKYDIQEVLDNSEILDRFYRLVIEMQKRAEGYPVRSKKYFRRLFNEFKGTNALVVFEASFEGDVIAMNISEFTNTWASSLYAGSNRLHPNLKAPYLLRWRSIQEAKARGCKVYDFWGIVPESKKHKGYSENKLSFGGERVDFVGILTIKINWKLRLWEALLRIQKIIIKLKYS